MRLHQTLKSIITHAMIHSCTRRRVAIYARHYHEEYGGFSPPQHFRFFFRLLRIFECGCGPQFTNSDGFYVTICHINLPV